MTQTPLIADKLVELVKLCEALEIVSGLPCYYQPLYLLVVPS